MFWKKFVITLFIFILILLYRAYVVFTPDKTIFEPCSSTNDNHSLEFHEQRLRTFQTLLQFQTISYEENNQNFTELKRCRNFIKQHYDDLITKYSKFVQLHDIAEYSLLYEIRGKNSNLKPFLLSAHFDVVPTGNLSPQKPGTNALQRTTSAVTLISGGEKENILPTSASATINHRIHTADSCQKILENNRRIINDDRIVPRVKNCVEPSPSSPYGKDVYSYRIIEQTIRQTFDKDRQPIIVVPGLMLGATDSRSYTNLSKNLYRFSPFIYHHDDLDRLHGDNERMTHLDVQRGLNFYFHLIVNNQLGHIPESKLNTEL
ncbi:unnamed protein product [Rotaria socialis]|uniref:N-acyl-aliphatic-L-amino acid amidohydrolase n=1 Tax=Rotaria socialis TaxID=392032 RepID=A0A821S5F6_9BILA|nr:unnamed protein product [Rotaria socialis]